MISNKKSSKSTSKIVLGITVESKAGPENWEFDKYLLNLNVQFCK